MAKTILDEIQQAITDYAKANGFSVMLDQRSLLYGQEAYDVTDEVLKVLNERYTNKKSSAKP
jgi:outer membrane protein